MGDLFLALDDALIAAQTAVLAAESLGIGSCYIGDIMENYETHRELLALPDYVFPAAMLCLGYYPEGYQPKFRSRFDQEFIVHSEKYRRLGEAELQSMFAELKRSLRLPTDLGRRIWGNLCMLAKRAAISPGK